MSGRGGQSCAADSRTAGALLTRQPAQRNLRISAGGLGARSIGAVRRPPAYIPGAWAFSPLSCFDVASCKIITAYGRPASSSPAQACGQLSSPAAPGRSPRSSQAAPQPPDRRPGNGGACTAYIDRLHLRQVVTYQPASRYWAFQWYETAIVTGLAIALTGFCFWRVRHRLA